MNILGDKYIEALKQQLLNELSQPIKNFESLLIEQEKKITKWDFANDEFYIPIPFYYELNKLKRGKLLKNVQFSERFEMPNIFSFGFSGDDALLLTQKSNGTELGINSKIYRYIENGGIEYFTICTYPSNNHPTKLVSLGVLTPKKNNVQVDIAMSGNKRNWTGTIYQYENNLVVKAFRYSEGWNEQTEYDFLYNNNLIEKIMIGKIDWWKSK